MRNLFHEQNISRDLFPWRQVLSHMSHDVLLQELEARLGKHRGVDEVVTEGGVVGALLHDVDITDVREAKVTQTQDSPTPGISWIQLSSSAGPTQLALTLIISLTRSRK